MTISSTIATALCRQRYVARSVVSRRPALYLPLARLRYAGRDDEIVSRQTDIVIEGFQRSGNTFAVTAFSLAQSQPVRIAHHLHAAAQVIRGVQLRLPVLVLIREPVDALLSHMVREPCASASAAAQNWVWFYESVSDQSDHVVVADFVSVTSDFGEVTNRVNARFGTRFGVFEHTTDNVGRCFAAIENRNIQRYGTLVESKVARPSTVRNELKAARSEELRDPALAGVLAHASTLYRTLTAGSNASNAG